MRISAADALRLEIVDDGSGLGPDAAAGVGLTSMRERAEELGGTIRLEPILDGGLRVLAVLPLEEGATKVKP